MSATKKKRSGAGSLLELVLIVATALDADCATLYTEDLQSGQVIDGRLTIQNPFEV